MKLSYKNWGPLLALVAAGLGIAAAGIYVGETDDAPGAALIGIVSAIGMIAVGLTKALRKPKYP